MSSTIQGTAPTFVNASRIHTLESRDLVSLSNLAGILWITFSLSIIPSNVITRSGMKYMGTIVRLGHTLQPLVLSRTTLCHKGSRTQTIGLEGYDGGNLFST